PRASRARPIALGSQSSSSISRSRVSACFAFSLPSAKAASARTKAYSSVVAANKGAMARGSPRTPKPLAARVRSSFSGSVLSTRSNTSNSAEPASASRSGWSRSCSTSQRAARFCRAGSVASRKTLATRPRARLCSRRAMINIVLNKIFGSKNERELKRMGPLVAEVSAKEPSLARLSDGDLRAKTDEFKKRLADGATLDDVLTDAFAVCREMSKRKLEMRHFDVQLIGGMVLHEGKISEMKTGEGKTLVATLALFLNALEGKGAHLVTVNDYLAKRDAQWMGPLYHNLGLSVGVIQHEASFLYDPTYEAED